MTPISAVKQPDIIFDFYEPCHEIFYIIRKEDIEIEESIDNYSLWVCGQTGVGKTNSVQRAISRAGGNLKYISLGYCLNESMEYIFNDILSNFLDDDHSFDQLPIQKSLRKIANIIKDLCKPCIRIVVPSIDYYK